VPKPTKNKKMDEFQINFVMLHLCRYFSSKDMLVDFHDIEREFSTFVAKDKKGVKECLMQVADEYQSGYWKRKPFLDGGAFLEGWEDKISPEDVCLHQSSYSAEWLLSQKGIVPYFDTAKTQTALQRMQKLLEFRRKRYKIVQKLASDLNETPRGKSLRLLAAILFAEITQLKQVMDTARYIHEQLLLTPWNITESFVKCNENNMLELKGVPGDPSGVGEGYSFLRCVIRCAV
jgi:hypothetical protein